MVTIKMIAEKCGLSVAAISKALNDQPGISQEKAAMVRRVAREMGYYPNVAAQILKTKRSYNIGILYQNGMAHEYFSLILESIRQAAESKNYDITFLSVSAQNKQEMGYYERAMYRQCDGVIIAQGNYDFNSVRRLAESDIPVVSIEQAFEGRTVITSDNVGSLEEIVCYLYSLGHRKLAFIHGEMGGVTRSRLAGFYRGCRKCGLTVPDGFVVSARYQEPGDSGDATCQLLRGKDPPTCILYPDDFSCIGGITAITSMGLSVPDDVSCFGFDGGRLTQILSPTIATYRQNAQKIGQYAVEEIICAAEDSKCYVPRTITVPGEIQSGGTVRDLTQT